MCLPQLAQQYGLTSSSKGPVVVTDKTDLVGKFAHPLYRYLTAAAPNPNNVSRITLNYEKFLLGPDGKVADPCAVFSLSPLSSVGQPQARGSPKLARYILDPFLVRLLTSWFARCCGAIRASGRRTGCSATSRPASLSAARHSTMHAACHTLRSKRRPS